MSSLTTNPSQIPIATTDLVSPIFDLGLFPNGVTATYPVATLTDITDLPGYPHNVSLADDPVLAANGRSIAQEIRGSVLTAGHRYQLVMVFTTTGSTRISRDVIIVCPR